VITSGTNEPGTGGLTVLAVVVATELQVPLDRVRVELEGTDVAPYDQGAGGSRFTYVGGNAALRAAQDLRQQLGQLAAKYLGCAPDDVDLMDGRFVDTRRPASAIRVDEIAARAASAEPLVGRGGFTGKPPTRTSFAAQVAEVQVDPDTGRVTVLRMVGVHDVGQVINYHGLTGQIDGGIAWGFGAGMMEELRIESGRVLNPHLGDYKVPCIADVPAFESILITDAPGDGPFGAKAVAELSLLPTAAAIVNAVHDAVGVWVLDLPISAERVRRSLTAQREMTPTT
jgi:CO/xanthine dehydrogenase Mo-binding subunit